MCCPLLCIYRSTIGHLKQDMQVHTCLVISTCLILDWPNLHKKQNANDILVMVFILRMKVIGSLALCLQVMLANFEWPKMVYFAVPVQVCLESPFLISHSSNAWHVYLRHCKTFY